MESLSTNYHQKVDALELAIKEGGEILDPPIIHRFLENMYIREMFLAKDGLIISKIHNSEHPYTVLTGKCLVLSENGGSQEVAAGYLGITKLGTRRVILAKEDCRWATYHVLTPEEESLRESGAPEEEILKMIENRIIEVNERSLA